MFSFFTKKNIKKNRKTKKKFNKLNCSPIVIGSSANSNTCYTKKILFEIRDSYNSSYLNTNKIKTNDPNEIWTQLHENLVDCPTESCWLKELKDKTLVNKIKKYVFAPKKPPEWKENPNEWLSNIDLLEVMKQYEMKNSNFAFIGPTTIDFDTKLPEENNNCVWDDLCKFSLEKYVKKGKDKIGIIFNLDKHDQSGSHWVSLFIDMKNSFIFFFDSAGNKIPNEINELVKRVTKQGEKLSPPIKFIFHENYPKVHQNGNTECGMYSLFFIITMLTHKINSKKFKDSDEIIKYFEKGYITDKYVEKYRNVYFNNEI